MAKFLKINGKEYFKVGSYPNELLFDMKEFEAASKRFDRIFGKR